LKIARKKLLIKKIWIVRIFGIIIACSLIFSVTFVSYTLTSAPDNIQTAIGYNGTFSNYFLLTTINNKPLYGFILACILFAYFLVLLSLWFSCFFAVYMTKRKGPEIRSWCIIRVCYFCCSLSCMKGMGLAASSRATKDVQPGDFSEDYDGLKNYGSIQGVSSISMNTDKNLKNSIEDDLSKEEYNPFDTASFKRREKHSTFHGWGNQKRGSTMGGDKGVYPRSDPFNIEENNPSNIQTSKTDENIPRPKPKSRTTSISTANSSLPNLSAAGGAPGKLQPQPPGRQMNDPLASHSMEEFPREILINPEYRSMLDLAARQIRLISHQKKKQEEEEKETEFKIATEIPPEISNSPITRERYSRDEFESGSDADFDYDGAPASPTGSEKDMLRGKEKKK